VLNVEQAQSFLQWRLTKNNTGGNLQDPPQGAFFGTGKSLMGRGLNDFAGQSGLAFLCCRA
jgi:hypothetical protein